MKIRCTEKYQLKIGATHLDGVSSPLKIEAKTGDDKCWH